MPADQRFVTEQPGIVTRSVFSFGPHYDPSRVGVGPLVAVDEHVVAPGAGFAEHAHRGVDIVSVVLAGRLRHEGSGVDMTVGAGDVLVQRTAGGVRHAETNPSRSEPLRLLQMSLLSQADDPSTYTARLPIDLDDLRLEVRTSSGPIPGTAFVLVLSGSWTLPDGRLTAGDAAWGIDLEPGGSGELLTWHLRTS